MSSDDDIIVALATPVGKGAIAVIRLSGTGSLSLVKNFIHKDLKHTRTTYLRKFIKNNEELDQVVITTSDHGYTGQETVEISCHNSQYIIQEIIKSFIDCGARLAHPGEFTQRAFLNGQFDLIQAEAIADLIAADTKKNHDLAIKQFNGIYSCAFNGMRQQLIDIISLIELEIDFSEEDIPLIDHNDVLTALQNIKQRLQNVCDSYQRGKIIKEGLHIAIIGKPNVGKSSLLNVLLDSDRAIVSDIPGTTRDTIEGTTVINGLKCIFIDTAGIHNTDDEVELLGIQRTQNVLKEAHLIIYLTDVLSMTADDSQIKSLLNERKYLIVVNKIDLMDVQLPQGYIGISAKKHINIDVLCNEIVNSLPNDNEDILITNLRHYNEALCAIKDLEDCISGIINGLPNDMISVDLRSATTHIGNIVGNINNEDILNNIFSNFCIGK